MGSPPRTAASRQSPPPPPAAAAAGGDSDCEEVSASQHARSAARSLGFSGAATAADGLDDEDIQMSLALDVAEAADKAEAAAAAAAAAATAAAQAAADICGLSRDTLQDELDRMINGDGGAGTSGNNGTTTPAADGALLPAQAGRDATPPTVRFIDPHTPVTALPAPCMTHVIHLISSSGTSAGPRRANDRHDGRRRSRRRRRRVAGGRGRGPGGCGGERGGAGAAGGRGARGGGRRRHQARSLLSLSPPAPRALLSRGMSRASFQPIRRARARLTLPVVAPPPASPAATRRRRRTATTPRRAPAAPPAAPPPRAASPALSTTSPGSCTTRCAPLRSPRLCLPCLRLKIMLPPLKTT